MGGTGWGILSSLSRAQNWRDQPQITSRRGVRQGVRDRGRASCVLLSGIMDLTYSPWWLSCDGMGNEDVFIGVGTLPRSENMGTFETFFFALCLSLRTGSFKVDRSPRER